MADWTPQSRAEEILFDTINGEPYDGLPQSRIEELLLELKEVIEEGGGGGGGTDNYNSLKNLPQINGQTVKGNMSGTTLGLVNMVMGKDLSTNDYTNADKAIVGGVTSALAGKADVSSVPTKTSDLTNDSGFITNLVNNLLNYYLKTETYSKSEVDSLLQAITTLDIQAVNTLPTTNISTTTIYLVPKQSLSSQNVKDEFINLDGTTSGWELIGNTQIDLSNYVTTSDLTTALADYVTSEQFSKEFFIGTQAVWNSLTVSQKTEYTFAIITDDYDDNPVGNLNTLPTADKSSAVAAIKEIDNNMVRASLVQCGLVAIQANELSLLHTLTGTENYVLLGALPVKVVDDQQTDVTHQIQLFIKGTSIYGLVDHPGNYKVLAAVFFKRQKV